MGKHCSQIFHQAFSRVWRCYNIHVHRPLLAEACWPSHALYPSKHEPKESNSSSPWSIRLSLHSWAPGPLLFLRRQQHSVACGLYDDMVRAGHPSPSPCHGKFQPLPLPTLVLPNQDFLKALQLSTKLAGSIGSAPRHWDCMWWPQEETVALSFSVLLYQNVQDIEFATVTTLTGQLAVASLITIILCIL